MTPGSHTASSARLAGVLGGVVAVLGAVVALLASTGVPSFFIGLVLGVQVVVMIAVGMSLATALAARRGRADRARLDEIDPLTSLRREDRR